MKYFNIKLNNNSFFYFTSFYSLSNVSLYYEQTFEDDLLFLKSDIAFLKTKNIYKRSVLFNTQKNIIDLNDGTSSSDDSDSEDEIPPVQTIIFEQSEDYMNFNKNSVFFKKQKDTIKDDYEDSSDESSQLKSINVKAKFKLFFNDNRKLLLEFFNFRKFRQKKFNRVFLNFVKLNSYQLLLMFELNFTNVLLRTNFLFSKKLINVFIQKQFIYLNGVVIKNTNRVLKPGDKIQFIIDKTFFFTYRRLLNYNILLQKKFSYVI